MSAPRPRLARRRWRVVPLALLALWLAAACALDQYGLGAAPREVRDAVVVAGCRVQPGGRPSLALARRTRRAVELWRAGLAREIITTGGVGHWPPAEAVVAADLARSLGVPASALVIEDRSTSTEENARFAAERSAARRIWLVTDSYHVFRAERVFRRYFRDVRGIGVRPRPFYRVKGALRELLALAVYALWGKV